MRVQSIQNPICHLAECPVWNGEDRALYWTDILERRIWRYDPHSGLIEVEWEGNLMFGGEKMNVLYITTACEGGADLARGLDHTGRYLGGEVFHICLDVVGRPEWPANF